MDFFDFVNKSQQQQQLKDKICETFRVGDTIKIVRLENSVLNYYKGYIGEIKEYKKLKMMMKK